MADSLETTLKILTTVNTIIPIVASLTTSVQAMFINQTPELTNTERIALLRKAGIMTVQEADLWLANHPEPPKPPATPDGG